MSSTKITKHDIDDSVLQGIATDVNGQIEEHNTDENAHSGMFAEVNHTHSLSECGVSFATAILTTDGWADNQQTVNVVGVTENNVVQVSGAPATIKAYGAAGVVCTAQEVGTLTFACDSVPEVELTVNVIILGV